MKNEDAEAILGYNRKRHFNPEDIDEAKKPSKDEIEADRLRKKQAYAPPEASFSTQKIVGSAFVVDSSGKVIDPKEELKKMTAQTRKIIEDCLYKSKMEPEKVSQNFNTPISVVVEVQKEWEKKNEWTLEKT